MDTILSVQGHLYPSSGQYNPKRLCGQVRSQRRADNYPRELPSGAVWLSKEATNHDVIYGQNFVLQRPKHGGPGLEISNRNTALSCMPAEPVTQLTVPTNRCTSVSAPTRVSWDVTDITDYTILGDSGLLPGISTPFLLPGDIMTVTPATPPASTPCTGIILHPEVEREPAEEDKNPRRTKKVKFTCNVCNTTNVKRVSPRGWSAGTVLARCDGCERVHKLVDNLKVFHELKGNVFPPRVPKGFKVPKGLPQKPDMDYHVHPSVYPHLPKE